MLTSDSLHNFVVHTVHVFSYLLPLMVLPVQVASADHFFLVSKDATADLLNDTCFCFPSVT